MLVLKLLFQLLYIYNLILKSLLKQNFHTFLDILAFLSRASQREKRREMLEPI